MTDAEISRRLALAIGWSGEDVRDNDGIYVEVFFVFSEEHGYKYWRNFDYRDPAVIWPIAERFNCFPSKKPWEDPARSWSVFFDDYWESGRTEYVEADTAAKAVALAVIKAHEGAKE